MQKPSFFPSDLNVPDEVAEKLNDAHKQHLFTLLHYKNIYLTENVIVLYILLYPNIYVYII